MQNRISSKHLRTVVVNSFQRLLQLCQTSKVEIFAETVNGHQPLTILVKSSILDV